VVFCLSDESAAFADGAVGVVCRDGEAVVAAVQAEWDVGVGGAIGHRGTALRRRADVAVSDKPRGLSMTGPVGGLVVRFSIAASICSSVMR